MKTPKPKPDWLSELRLRAEELLSKEKSKELTGADAFASVHELLVQQTELEMQNEELKRSRLELEESRNKYLELYEFSPIGYFTLDKQTTILEVNLSGAALLGVERESLVRRRFQLFVETGSRSEFNTFCNRVFESDVKQTSELRLVKKDAPLLYAYLEGISMRNGDGDVIYCQIAVVDITKQKHAQDEEARLKDQLSHAQNLASVGILAGGVAHNFNNLLMVVMGYATILQMELEKGGPLGGYAQRIIHATQMAGNLSKDLLAFSRKKPVHLQAVNVNTIIKNTEDMLPKLMRENSKCKMTFTEKDCFVMADSDQITHVLINLATNARDAMPNGGELKISTEVVDMDDAFVKAHGFGTTGKYVLTSFSDTGVGMDENTRLRIFEPFFTTKEVGKGTGLGLATVYGIIKQHHGHIDVESKKGIGTTFRIYLPAVTAGSRLKTETEIALKAGTETVLLAEDELYVSELIKTVFEKNGYGVITAVNGSDAVEKFMQNRDKIHLLLFDIIMPFKSGKQAYEEIKKINPDIKVVFMSGYDDSISNKIDIIHEGLDYIPKPVSPLKLLEKVREALDR
ncbi:MAG: hypothetical protein HW390_170 [Candidatus Brocadiaceae bacterium]|nr:hypothetical protein [Candidatus Brocadiaceae bacterium]